MTRTAEASNWKSHEDKILYSVISEALNKDLPKSEVYEEASNFFMHMPTFPNRSANACRQRWNKISEDESLKEELSYIHSDIPITTGIQQEINFEQGGILMDAQFRPEQLDDQQQDTQDDTFKEEIRLDKDHSFTQLRGFINSIEYKFTELEQENSSLKNDNLGLSLELEKANKELEAYRKIKEIFESVQA